MKDRSLLENYQYFVSNERAKLLAVLINKIGDIQLAEDCLQEALIKAYQIWDKNLVAKSPKSWIVKIAYHKAIDFIRRQSNFEKKQDTLFELGKQSQYFDAILDDEEIPDERLKLIFTCCHPALDESSQTALTLNTICGLSVEEIAASFIVTKTTMAQRLVRAKRKIKLSNIPYKVPESKDLSIRVDAVLAVIYLIYNQGYYSDSNTSLINHDHTKEALYLAEILDKLLPNHAETLGLLALMHFHQSRFLARTENDKEIITLEHQKRNLWDQDEINRANRYFKKAMGLNSIGVYQIQSAISGVHSQAKSFAQTDWQQICGLYEKLYSYLATDTVIINQAVALCYNHQAQRAYELLQKVDPSKLKSYQPYYLAKAHVYKTLNKNQQAISNLSLAMALANNQNEKTFLQGQIDLINA